MPQTKINFVGSNLDPEMPSILYGKMKPEIYEEFVGDVNGAIRDTQDTMKWSPYAILFLVCLAIVLVILDVSLASVLGKASWGLIVLAACVFLGMCLVCYLSTCRPTKECESRIQKVCRDYSDAEKNIYFFYRSHAAVRRDENQFFVEVFVEQTNQMIPYETPANSQLTRQNDSASIVSNLTNTTGVIVPRSQPNRSRGRLDNDASTNALVTLSPEELMARTGQRPPPTRSTAISRRSNHTNTNHASGSALVNLSPEDLMKQTGTELTVVKKKSRRPSERNIV